MNLEKPQINKSPSQETHREQCKNKHKEETRQVMKKETELHYMREDVNLISFRKKAINRKQDFPPLCKQL